MFDIGFTELLVIGIVALVVIGPERLPRARSVQTVAADRSGTITGLDAEMIGRTAVLLGAGRERKDDPVDPGTGVRLVRTVGESVRAGDAVLELHVGARAADDATRLAAAAIAIGDAAPDEAPLVQAWVHAAGEERLA